LIKNEVNLETSMILTIADFKFIVKSN